MKHSLFTLIILSTAIVSFGIEVNVVHKWKNCEYEWNSQEQKENAIKSGSFNPYYCVFFDAIKADDGRVFITTPKYFGHGVPVSLVTVTNTTGSGGPLLRPYPDWSWHNKSYMCDGIVNVYRTHINCNYIFVLDSGVIGANRICNPKVLIFDLKDDTLVKTIYIPLDMATDERGVGILISPFTYIPGGCTQFLDKMTIFLADSKGNGGGLVIYDSSTKRMCRVESDYMKPTYTSFSVSGHNFTFVNGIFGMTILDDELYYTVVSGMEIYKMKIDALLECPNKEEANKQTKSVVKLSSQTAELASAGHSIFYGDSFGLSILGTTVSDKNEFDKKTMVLAQNNEIFQTITTTKSSRYWKQITGLSNKFQRMVQKTFSLNETNFYYYEMDLVEILKMMDSSL